GDPMRVKAKSRARCVMRGELAGRDWRLNSLPIPLRERSPERLLDVGAGEAAGAQQHRFAQTGDNGRFKSDLRRPAVEDDVDAAGKIGERVLRGRGRKVAGAV